MVLMPASSPNKDPHMENGLQPWYTHLHSQSLTWAPGRRLARNGLRLQMEDQGHFPQTHNVQGRDRVSPCGTATTP